MSDDVTIAAAEWVYERDWRSRRWPGEEAMRPRPTFAQLRTGETARPPEYARLEMIEAIDRIKDAQSLVDILRPLIEADLRERLGDEIEGIPTSDSNGIPLPGRTIRADAVRIVRGES